MKSYDYFEKRNVKKNKNTLNQNLSEFYDFLDDFARLTFNSCRCVFSRHIPTIFYGDDKRHLVHTISCARCYRYMGLGRFHWHDVPIPYLPGDEPMTFEEWTSFAKGIEQELKILSYKKKQHNITINVQDHIDRVMLDRAGLGIFTNPIAIPPEYWDAFRG